MPTTFVEVTPEEADKLWEAGLLWSQFLVALKPGWRYEPYSEPVECWESLPSSWGSNWTFAIQVEE